MMFLMNFKSFCTIFIFIFSASYGIKGEPIFNSFSNFIPRSINQMTTAVTDLSKSAVNVGYNAAVGIPIIGGANEKVLSALKTTAQGTFNAAAGMPFIGGANDNVFSVLKTTAETAAEGTYNAAVGMPIIGGANEKVLSALKTTAETAAQGTYNAALNVKDTAFSATEMFQKAFKEVSETTLTLSMNFLLNAVKSFLSDTIKLSEVEKDFGIIGSFKTSEGVVGSLKSLEIARNIELSQAMPSVLVNITLTIKDFYVHYPSYSIRTYFGTLKGSLEVSIPTNLINVQLSICIVNQCVVNVRRVEVVKLENIKVNTGAQGFEIIMNNIINYLKDVIKEKVQTAIDNALKAKLQDEKFLLGVCNSLDPQKLFSLQL